MFHCADIGNKFLNQFDLPVLAEDGSLDTTKLESHHKCFLQEWDHISDEHWKPPVRVEAVGNLYRQVTYEAKWAIFYDDQMLTVPKSIAEWLDEKIKTDKADSARMKRPTESLRKAAKTVDSYSHLVTLDYMMRQYAVARFWTLQSVAFKSAADAGRKISQQWLFKPEQNMVAGEVARFLNFVRKDQEPLPEIAKLEEFDERTGRSHWEIIRQHLEMAEHNRLHKKYDTFRVLNN